MTFLKSSLAVGAFCLFWTATLVLLSTCIGCGMLTPLEQGGASPLAQGFGAAAEYSADRVDTLFSPGGAIATGIGALTTGVGTALTVWLRRRRRQEREEVIQEAAQVARRASQD